MEASDLILSPTGVVYPPRPAPPVSDVDIRTIMLRRFAQYLSLLRFRRTGDEPRPDRAIEFQVPRKSIHIEQPDNVKDLHFPGIGILPGRGTFEPTGLGPPPVLEESWNVYAPGTVLVLLGEYSEQITVEVWGSHRAERRALLTGIARGLRASSDTYPIRIRLPEHYDRTAEFWLEAGQHIDDPDVVRGRRRGHLFVNMRASEVQLVNVVTMRPYVMLAACGVEVAVDGSDTVASVEVSGP